MWTIIDPDNNPDKTGLPDIDEALELSLNDPPRGSTVKLLLNGLLCLVLSLVLVAQYIAYNFATLSQNPQARAWLEPLCQTQLCTLKPLLNPQLVRSEELMVNRHPDHPDVLLLQMRFRNMADYRQAMPAIDIVFSGIDGEPIAGRRFFPREYLGETATGDLTGNLEMAARAAVMASLSIVDPGDMAVNYEISFIDDFAL
jgi:hypothetical protein